MSVRRRMRFTVFGRGRAAAAVTVAMIVNLLAALRTLEPSAGAGSATREIGAFLAIGLLIMTAAVAASSTRRVLRVRSRSNRLGLLSGVVLRCIAGAASAVGLALPALAVAWDGGATASELGGLALALLGAVACGSVLGLLFAVIGLHAPAAAVAAAAAGALCLWPATLGWSGDGMDRFPGVETPLLLLLAALTVAAVVGARTLAVREAIR